jgi:hypothetical protein
MVPMGELKGNWFMHTGEWLCIACLRKKVKDMQPEEMPWHEQEEVEDKMDVEYTFKRRGELYE